MDKAEHSLIDQLIDQGSCPAGHIDHAVVLGLYRYVLYIRRLTIVLGQTMEKIHQSIPNGALSFIRTAD